MRTGRRGVAALLLGSAMASMAGTARADIDPPRYDSSGLCLRESNTPEGISGETVMECLSSQRHAFDDIRKRWNEIPATVQDMCDQSTRATGKPDYNALQNCLRTQMRRNPPAATIPRDLK